MSNVYSIAQEHGHLFCTEMDGIWKFDARFRFSRDQTDKKDSGDRFQAVAWYKHREMTPVKTNEGFNA